LASLEPSAEGLTTLVDRPRRIHPGIEFDLAKGVFILNDVLLKNREQRLRLLRTDVDSLKICDFDLRLALLLQGAEDQEEVPNVDADLHAVGVVLAVGRRIGQFDIGLRGHHGLSV
jgi:hypothetical protein